MQIVAMIADIKADSRNVSVKGKVIEKKEPREVSTRFGKKFVGECTVEDETGRIVLVLWEDDIGKVKEGDTIEVKNGYVTLWNGVLQLNIGKFGSLEVL